MSERYHSKGNGIWYDEGSDPEEFSSDDVIDVYADEETQSVEVLLEDGTKICPDFTTGGDYIGNSREWYRMILSNTERFADIPEPAQKLLLAPYVPFGVAVEIIRESADCMSPIEEILFIAIKIASYCRRSDFKIYDDKGVAVGSYGARILPQHEIKASNQKYILDFLIHVYASENYFRDYVIANPGDEIFLGIECDGFDYHHASKEQVSHDYERELAIKMSGIDIIRFTGSQIYNDPKKCANDVLDYIISSIIEKRRAAQFTLRRESNGNL